MPLHTPRAPPYLFSQPQHHLLIPDHCRGRNRSTDMSQLPPQTLTVKRKRTEAPVDALRFDHTVSIKRQKSNQHFAYRRLQKPDEGSAPNTEPPTPTTERRFHLDASTKPGAKRVFIEARSAIQRSSAATDASPQASTPELTPESTPRPRKRPGAGAALLPSAYKVPQHQTSNPEPSETKVRELEALSHEVEKVDNLHIPLPSPSKYKPRAPAQRFAERHPDKAAALASPPNEPSSTNNPDDAMEIDTDDYVIDTFIREPLHPDSAGNLPPPSGAVGLLVLSAEDEDWWDGSDESDKEFDTDDEDENAEDYYANDYPEDELSDDDEFGRDAYQKGNRRGSDDEEWGANVEDEDDAAIASGEDEDDLHYKMTVPKAQRVGYWGAVGE